MKMEEYERSSDVLEVAAMLGEALGQSSVMPLRPKDESLLAQAETFGFGAGRIGWSVGSGPVVLLVHGYSGRGVQMAALAFEIARQGFRAIFFDAGGHGASRVEKIGFFTFINDTRDIVDHLNEPIFAMIGHSAGGLAMMRARDLYGVAAERYTLISAPFYPYVPLEGMLKRGAPTAALPYVKAILADQFRTSWSSLARGVAYVSEKSKPLLAIYDTDDERVRHTDADRLGAIWPGARIVKTKGYGHNRILQADEALQAVVAFLTSRHDTDEHRAGSAPRQKSA